jgi:pyridinium-3,5-biscarboxylic acid mononucleotide sulfurtransferase
MADYLEKSLEIKLTQLQQIFKDAQRVLVAYSGGIDSTLIAKIAFDVLGDQAIAVTANSPSLLPSDLEAAIAQAIEIGISHQVINTLEMENPNYTSNPVNRCYFCKSELHDRLKPLAKNLGYEYVIDGLNADDLKDYRPGIMAAKERGVRSPLAEVEVSKIEVRMLSKYLNLPWWNKPSQPCLSSRFPYGESITTEKLQRVGKAEQYLRLLLENKLGSQLEGKINLRVRSMEDTAKIEINSDLIASFVQAIDLCQLTTAFKNFGFQTVTLDLEGFRSGKLNDNIKT